MVEKTKGTDSEPVVIDPFSPEPSEEERIEERIQVLVKKGAMRRFNIDMDRFKNYVQNWELPIEEEMDAVARNEATTYRLLHWRENMRSSRIKSTMEIADIESPLFEDLKQQFCRQWADLRVKTFDREIELINAGEIEEDRKFSSNEDDYAILIAEILEQLLNSIQLDPPDKSCSEYLEKLSKVDLDTVFEYKHLLSLCVHNIEIFKACYDAEKLRYAHDVLDEVNKKYEIIWQSRDIDRYQEEQLFLKALES